MFGGGMGGGGFGGGQRGRYPQLRMARFGIVFVVILAGTALHHTGTAYNAIRVLYFILLIGGLVFAFTRRRAGRQLRGPFGPGPTNGPGAGLGRQTIDVRPRAQETADLAQRPPGWFPDPAATDTERYWDGTIWTRVRRRVDGAWVEQ